MKVEGADGDEGFTEAGEDFKVRGGAFALGYLREGEEWVGTLGGVCLR